MEGESWKASGNRSTQEAPRNHPGVLQEAPRIHPGGPRSHPGGPLGYPEAPRSIQKVPKDTAGGPQETRRVLEVKCVKGIQFSNKSDAGTHFFVDGSDPTLIESAAWRQIWANVNLESCVNRTSIPKIHHQSSCSNCLSENIYTCVCVYTHIHTHTSEYIAISIYPRFK